MRLRPPQDTVDSNYRTSSTLPFVPKFEVLEWSSRYSYIKSTAMRPNETGLSLLYQHQ